MALELAAEGVKVYATGRTAGPETFPAHSGVIPVRCDHTDDPEVEAVFERIMAEQGGLDILVNNVWGGYENMVENGQFT